MRIKTKEGYLDDEPTIVQFRELFEKVDLPVELLWSLEPPSGDTALEAYNDAKAKCNVVPLDADPQDILSGWATVIGKGLVNSKGEPLVFSVKIDDIAYACVRMPNSPTSDFGGFSLTPGKGLKTITRLIRRIPKPPTLYVMPKEVQIRYSLFRQPERYTLS